jgi:hypothetical protein
MHNFPIAMAEAHAIKLRHNSICSRTIPADHPQNHLDNKIIDFIHYHNPHRFALHNNHNFTARYMSKAGEFAQLLLPFITHDQALQNFRHFSTTTANTRHFFHCHAVHTSLLHRRQISIAHCSLFTS